jgi:hypothetical protein
VFVKFHLNQKLCLYRAPRSTGGGPAGSARTYTPWASKDENPRLSPAPAQPTKTAINHDRAGAGRCGLQSAWSLPGRRRRGPRRERIGGMPRTKGSRAWLSFRFPPGMPSDKGRALLSVTKWIFDPNFPRSVGIGLASRLLCSSKAHGVDRASPPARTAAGTQIVGDPPVEASPLPIPAPQSGTPAPAGIVRAWPGAGDGAVRGSSPFPAPPPSAAYGWASRPRAFDLGSHGCTRQAPDCCRDAPKAPSLQAENSLACSDGVVTTLDNPRSEAL